MKLYLQMRKKEWNDLNLFGFTKLKLTIDTEEKENSSEQKKLFC